MRATGDGVFCAGVTQYAVCEDVHKICDVLRLIRSEIAEDLAAQFVLELQVMESPKELAQRLVDTVFFQDVWVAVCLGLMQPVRGSLPHFHSNLFVKSVLKERWSEIC